MSSRRPSRSAGNGDRAVQAVIEDKSFPLDENLLLTIVSSVLQCDPKNCVYLPLFRLDEFLDVVLRSQSQLLNEFKLAESYMHLYVLCVYCTLSADLPSGFLLRFMTFLQHIIVESLVIIQNYRYHVGGGGKARKEKDEQQLQQTVMSPLPHSLFHSEQVEPEFAYDLFFEALEYGRNLLREVHSLNKTLKVIRDTTRNLEERKQKLPHKVDALHAMHTYFMTSMAFTHICFVRQRHLVGTMAGTIETLSVILLSIPPPTTHPTEQSLSSEITAGLPWIVEGGSSASEKGSRPGTSSTVNNRAVLTANTNRGTSSKQQQRNIPSFERSIGLAQQLASITCHRVCDIFTLQTCAVARNRLAKQIVHAEAPLLQYKTQIIRDLLAPPGSIASSGGKGVASKSTTNGNVAEQGRWQPEPSFHFFNDIVLPLEQQQRILDDARERQQELEEADEDEREARHVQAQIDAAEAANAEKTRLAMSTASGRQEQRLQGPVSPSTSALMPKRLKKSKSQTSVVKLATKPTANASKATTQQTNAFEEKRQTHYGNLKKSFREAFLVLDALHLPPRATTLTANTSNAMQVQPLPSHTEDTFCCFVPLLRFQPRPAQGDGEEDEVLSILPASEEWRSIFHREYRPSFLLSSLATALTAFVDYGHQEEEHQGNKSDQPNMSRTRKPKTQKKSNQMTMTECARHVEAVYYHHLSLPLHTPTDGHSTALTAATARTPTETNSSAIHTLTCYRSRLLRPTQPVFWLTSSILDYWLQLHQRGEGICRGHEEEKRFLQLQLRRLQRGEGILQQPPNHSPHHQHHPRSPSRGYLLTPSSSSSSAVQGLVKAIPSFASPSNATGDSPLKLPPIPPSPSLQSPSLSSPSPTKQPKQKKQTLDLGARLAQAKQTAQVEARLHTLNALLQGEQVKDVVAEEKAALEERTRSYNIHGDDDEQSSSSSSSSSSSADGRHRDSGDADSDEERDEHRPLPGGGRGNSRGAYPGDNGHHHRSNKHNNHSKKKHRKDKASTTNDEDKDARTQQQHPQWSVWHQSRSRKLEAEAASKLFGSSHYGGRSMFVAVEDANELRGKLRKRMDDALDDNPLKDVPRGIAPAVAYAMQLQQQKDAEQEAADLLAQSLADQQENIVNKNKTLKTQRLRQLRDRAKEEIAAQQSLQQEYLDAKRRIEEDKRKRQKEEEQHREQAHLMECLRIREMQLTAQYEEERQKELHAEELEHQKMLISLLKDRQETEEILRRNREEDHMRQQEERRFVLETRRLQNETQRNEERARQQQAILEKINSVQHRLRRGHFHWHQGTFGFYDHVRPEEKILPYVACEDPAYAPVYDPNHKPPNSTRKSNKAPRGQQQQHEHVLYYDPVLGTWQRRKPDDADIVLYEDEQRKAYDAVHGPGIPLSCAVLCVVVCYVHFVSCSSHLCMFVCM